MYDCPERWRTRLFLASCFISAALSADGCANVVAKQKMPAEMHKVFADSDWYVARPEAEQEWRGVLRKRNVTLGPASRAAVSLELVVEGRQPVPVYAANIGARLVQYVGNRVTIRGKLVDLTEEGHGKELWIGWMREDE